MALNQPGSSLTGKQEPTRLDDLQVDSNNGGEFTISWVKLGSGTQAEIKAMIDGRIKFAQIFSVASPSSPGVCPATFSPVNTGAAGFECIKLMVRIRL